MKYIAPLFLALALAAQAAPIAKIYQWDSRVEDGAAFALAPTRGETMVLQPRLLSYGSPMDLTDANSVRLLYRAVGDTNVYPVTGGVLLATNGQVQVVFTASNELPASTYAFDVLISSPTSSVVGARGMIKYRDGVASGAQFATNQPIRLLDFATTVLLNIGLSPWLLRTDLTGVVAGVTSILNTSDIQPSGDGTGDQSLYLSTTRTQEIARGVAAWGVVSGGVVKVESDPTLANYSITLGDQTRPITAATFTAVGNVVSVTGTGGLSNSGPTTGAVTIALSAGSQASLAKADAAVTNPALFATAAQGAKADVALTNPAQFATAAQGAYADGWHSVSQVVVAGSSAGATALQPSSTNGWEVGSHAGFLTNLSAAGTTITNWLIWAGPAASQPHTNANTIYLSW